MSAILCGKRSFFEELNVTSPPTTVNKRIRCSSSSPVGFSPPRSTAASSNRSFLIDQLLDHFPDMDKQLLERALEENDDDLDSAIRSLNELRLGSADNNLDANGSNTGEFVDANVQEQGIRAANAELPPVDNNSTSTNLQMNGAEWVELFVSEMMSASNIDDARARASRTLEVLEKSICAHAGAEAAKSFHQENVMLKEQVQAVLQETAILKRAVAIQHERQKEYEDRNQELQHLKQLVSQYQDQLRTLEINNYALTMHLKQAQQSSSIPGQFHPDVF